MSHSWKGKASASGQVSDSVERDYDDYVPDLIDNSKVQQAELKEKAIGDPSLLPALPPAAAMTKPDSQASESAAENVELGKRKIEEKGKGKEMDEKKEDGGEEEVKEVEEEEEEEEAAVQKPKRKKRKGRKQKKRSVSGLLQITEKTDIRPEDQDYEF